MLEAISAINSENVVASNDTVYSPPFKALLITKAGVVVVKNEKNQTVTITIDDSIASAVFVPGRVRQILATDTTVPDANILGVR
jgi:hypothetical protein